MVEIPFPPPDDNELATLWAKKWADTEAERVGLAMKAAVLQVALERIAAGVDHPAGVHKVPHFYEAVAWAQSIARDALKGWVI